MRVSVKCAIALVWAMLLPSVAFAQASIAGVVRDASGAVLPGVTVEAASSVLIEKVRTAVTDGNGRYEIVDLRPGDDYAVTFALPGFNTVKRDGISIAGAATVTVDADLRVGSLEETITVTGEAPTVDVQSATRQLVLDRETVQLVPSGRNYYNLGAMVVGVNSNSADVGGALGDTMSSLTIHGSKIVDQRITNNGVSVMTLQAGGNIGGPTPDVSAATEITVDTSAVGADLPTGGVRINMIPRDGGNTFGSSSFITFSNESLQGNNLTDRLIDLGLATPAKNIKIWDINPAFGGPIKRDKVWFWASGRYQGTENQPAGVFINRNAWNPNAWTYDPDLSQPARNKGVWHSIQTRFTWQANAKNKIAATWQQQNYCRCPEFISATAAPETAQDRRFPRLQQQHAEWTSPLTNRLLVEAVGMHLYERWGNMHLRVGDGNFFHTGGSLTDPAIEAVMPLMVPVLEQSTGMLYRMGPAANNNVNNNLFNNTAVPSFFYRAAMSYVTGTHNFKMGFNRVHGYLRVRNYDFQPVTYRFNNGVPNLITMRATPYTTEAHQDNDFGLFAQDRWTLDRWTFSGGLRFDAFQTSYPEQSFGPGPLVPTRNITFPAQDNLDWKDITYRSAATWDMFGNGKTALKLTLNKYLQGQTLNGLGVDANPFNTLVNTATRAWTDGNRNFVPDCVLTNPAAQDSLASGGDLCGATTPAVFGAVRPAATFDPDLISGWGHRTYNWEGSIGVQHEIVPRVAVDIGYFRRWFGNFRVTDNTLLAPEDFDQFSLTVPRDARLPDGGGYTIDGLYDVKSAKFGQEQLLNTLSDKYGKWTEHWNGVDVSLNARLQNGITLRGGVSTGSRAVDMCDVTSKIPEFLFGPAGVNLGDNNNNIFLPNAFCHQEEPFLTQIKGSGIYTIPVIDVLIAGSFVSIPGPLVAANYTATNQILAATSTLGRPLSGNTPNKPINIVAPGDMYVERLNQLDFRVGKLLRFRGARAAINFDLYNALNVDTIRTINNSYASWQAGGPRPTANLLARFAKISATIDF